MKKVLVLLAIAVAFANCGGKGSKSIQKKNQKPHVEAPIFSGDSAYAYVDAQVAFGPRVPNTPAHDSCAQYLGAKLKEFGAELIVQEATLTAYNGTKLHAKNIIGSYNPQSKNRVLLMAHWDSRPYADNAKDDADKKKPILGANDGASGVGILLEIARQFNQKAPGVGVDIIFFDAEDYGTPDWVQNQGNDTWCLGSQYWAKNPHVKGYYAQYGILLDMVGAPKAVFAREALSMHYARHIVQKVWDTANEIGFSDYFSYEKSPQIVDDHMYVNQIIGIPTIDIVQYEPSTGNYFGKYWHTHDDDMSAIDKETLTAVGQTLLEVIYNE